MALSDKDKHRVINYLGWSGLTIVTGSTQFNKVVSDRVGISNAQIESLVKGLLARLEKLDAQLEEAACRLSASEVDNIVLNDDEIHMLRSERKRYIRELSDTLDIPVTKSSGGNVEVVN